MNTFLHRDTRKQMLQAAFVALGDAPNDLRTPLQAELDALQSDDWAVSDRTYLAVGADWLWSARLMLKPMVDDDPVLLALGRPANLTDAQAAAIETLPHLPGGPPPNYLDQVRAAVAGDETILRALLHAAHRRWIVQAPDERVYPFDDVGVLLPVRLETLFDGPASLFNDDPTRWKLSLRVIPDEASICRDNRHVSAGEQKALTDFWNAIKQPGTPDANWLDGDSAGVAWQQLSGRVTAARAAWLVANLEPRLEGNIIVVDQPADMPVKPQPNRVGGLPPELHIVAITTIVIDGETRHTLGRLPMEADKQIDGNSLMLPLPAVLEEERKRWWSDWKIAKSLGLGGEWLLPDGMTPQNIDTLYVVGIGDETPESHFKAQVDSGELGVLRLGVPTNAVHGNAAADLGKADADWRKIAQMRLRQQANPAQMILSGVGRNLQQHVLGSENDLPFFLGADSFDNTQDSQRMAHALWPALWGHWLLEMWEVGEAGYRVGNWMIDNFCPEGPLMPLRIGDQPYGLLPVTALSQWHSSPGFNPEAEAQASTEQAMASSLTNLCAQWAAAVNRKRSVVGKTTEQFMQLLGQDALSRRYIQREFIPAWVSLAPYIAAMGLNGEQQQEFLKRARRSHAAAVKQMGREPGETYLATGIWRLNELPLVQPRAMIYRRSGHNEKQHFDLTAFLLKLYEGRSLELLFEEGLRVLPDSLLIRLLTYSAQLAAPWRQTEMTSAQKRIAQFQEEGMIKIGEELDQDAWRGILKDEATGEIESFTVTVPDERRDQLERALRATLDSAAHRIDPWITGFAWQRLKQHSDSPRRAHRLGIYGWVDGPFNGTPGPTDAGRLHTPSQNQTLAALVLRDKFLSSRRAGLVNDSGRNPWEMNITSRKARLAEEIADEVRMGFNAYEVIGRHVENIMGDRAGGFQIIKQLRTSEDYAMRPERRDPNEVCNGKAALTGLLGPGPPFALLGGDPTFVLTKNQQAALQLLQESLDTYSDLLMADGVMQLVNRQAERAAETMEAASGLSRPPSFEFIRTPPSGYQLESVVLAALPHQSLEKVGQDASPIRLADPSVAAFLDAELGDDWVWTARNLGDDREAGRMNLATLGFAAHETLALSTDFLGELVRRKLGIEKVRIIAPRQHALAQQLVAVLGSRPAAGRDFGSEPAAQQAADREIYEEMVSRYQRLHASCRSLLAGLQAAADVATRTEFLRRALIWGVTPISEPANREALFALLLGLPVAATPLATLVETAVAVLQKRLEIAPAPEALPSVSKISSPLEDHEDLKRTANPDGISSLALAIANLASPNSKLAILACWRRDTLIAGNRLKVDHVESSLDETWLTVVAPTRANLARLEALQLELDRPLSTWSSSPGDPWQQKLVAENLKRRDTPHEKQEGETTLGLLNYRFTAAYGTEGSWDGEKVAVGMVDAFSEAIPMPHRTSTAAFGFNAPAARAPQAILLAVPPKPRQRLDSRLVQQIVAETRQLAHARTARMEDLGAFQSLTPTMWLQSSDPTRVHLEPYPLFE